MSVVRRVRESPSRCSGETRWSSIGTNSGEGLSLHARVSCPDEALDAGLLGGMLVRRIGSAVSATMCSGVVIRSDQLFHWHSKI